MTADLTKDPTVGARQKEFDALVAEAAACRRCEAMCGRSAVLSGRNGRVGARVMFVGEAPGRQGGDRTRVPFSGDQSGRNFTRYLASIGLRREEIFITNAALCNPRSESGANRRPTRQEVANCSEFLRRQVEAVDPRVVVTLGAVSLEALRGVEYHRLTQGERRTDSRVGRASARAALPPKPAGARLAPPRGGATGRLQGGGARPRPLKSKGRVRNE